MEGKIKIAIIGCGNIATKAHAPQYEKLKNVYEVVAVCDIIRGKAEKLADMFGGCEVYTDYKEVLGIEGLDAVDICTPNYLHSVIAVDALNKGLVDAIPELIWNLLDGRVSVARYRYHAHVCKRFTNAFADQCGAWCRDNGLALTGHMMEEPTLKSQTGMLGEAMPSYRSFQIQGIDMLCAKFEFNTAKQCQSAVRQYGREAMMSELYGVTSWDFNFRGYKIAGDWQAAMGVTVRVPHLSWVSMEGEAKRDYPAAFGYQSPWYRKFGYVEDHFARLKYR